jgi:hypothetical protein
MINWCTLTWPSVCLFLAWIESAKNVRPDSLEATEDNVSNMYDPFEILFRKLPLPSSISMP